MGKSGQLCSPYSIQNCFLLEKSSWVQGSAILQVFPSYLRSECWSYRAAPPRWCHAFSICPLENTLPADLWFSKEMAMSAFVRKTYWLFEGPSQLQGCCPNAGCSLNCYSFKDLIFSFPVSMSSLALGFLCSCDAHCFWIQQMKHVLWVLNGIFQDFPYFCDDLWSLYLWAPLLAEVFYLLCMHLDPRVSLVVSRVPTASLSFQWRSSSAASGCCLNDAISPTNWHWCSCSSMSGMPLVWLKTLAFS